MDLYLKKEKKVISADEFLRRYWHNYILIEKEFTVTTQYVTVAEDNYNTYSNAYIKLLIQIGSEIDIMARQLCKLIDDSNNATKMPDYVKCISGAFPKFQQIGVQEIQEELSIKPWCKLEGDRPVWWRVYNKVKHNRTEVGEINGVRQEYYKFANLEFALSALMALYQIEIYSYNIIARREKKEIVVPIPASRLFVLKGEQWNQCEFYGDSAFYLKDGNLFVESGCFSY